STVSQGVRSETNPLLAKSTKTFLASPPLHPIPETTVEESRTAIGFTPILFYPADDFHDLLHGFGASCPIFIELLKCSIQCRPFCFLLATYQVSDHITGRGKAFLHFA